MMFIALIPRYYKNNNFFLYFSFPASSQSFVVEYFVWAIRADTYTYVWTNINNGHLLYINTTKKNMTRSMKTY